MADANVILGNLEHAYLKVVTQEDGLELFSMGMDQCGERDKWSRLFLLHTNCGDILDAALTRLSNLPDGPSLTPCAALVVVLSAIPEGTWSGLIPNTITSCFEGVIVPKLAGLHVCENAYLLSCLRSALHVYTKCAGGSCKSYRRCFQSLSRVNTILSPTGEQLTPAHPLMLRVALDNSHFTLADSLLSSAIITEIDPTKTGCTLADFIQYYHYEAMLHLARRCYPSALRALHSAMSVPGYGGSDPTLVRRCYPLYILTHVMMTAKSPTWDTMEDINKHVDRAARSQCKDYMEFATTFETLDAAAIRRCAQEKAATWEHDSTSDVIAQCIESVPMHRLRSWTRVCCACTLADAAQEVFCDVPVETSEPIVKCMILKLVASGELRCIMSPTSSGSTIVRFLTVAPTSTTSENTRCSPLASVVLSARSPQERAACAATIEKHTLVKEAVAVHAALQSMYSRMSMSAEMLRSLPASDPLVAQKHEEWGQKLQQRSLVDAMLGRPPHSK